ncbi:MFS transporter [Bradyrhizobium sp. USDA 4510]
MSAHGKAPKIVADPEVRLPLTGRSGPLVVEIEYRVARENARAFHKVMQDVQLSRKRNGAYSWSIVRIR